MKIGYPCINRSISCSSNKTFRLKSYSEARLKETIESNLLCLFRILRYNVQNHLLFFRITSDLVPFASHPINTFDWQEFFKSDFQAIGNFIVKNRIRISMHPDQFTLINSIREEIFERSKAELQYHSDVLDLMNLDTSAKIQIHVGGAYDDKPKSMERFVTRLDCLSNSIRQRLVVENDDKLYDIGDCLKIREQTSLPVLFDAFHHRLNKRSNLSENYFELAAKTWASERDGVPMVDYSSKKPGGSATQHAEHIDLNDFQLFLRNTQPIDFDVMLEIKDKEKSALKALEIAAGDKRVRALY